LTVSLNKNFIIEITMKITLNIPNNIAGCSQSFEPEDIEKALTVLLVSLVESGNMNNVANLYDQLESEGKINFDSFSTIEESGKN